MIDPVIHVVILSPVPAMRAGLRALISGEDGFAVDAGWGPAEEGESPFLRIAIVTAEVLEMMDTGAMPAGEVPPEAPILLVQDGSEASALTPLPAALTGRPCWGVISSEADGEALRAALRALAQGLVVLPPDRAQELLAQREYERGIGAKTPIFGPDEEPVEPLTPREGDVLRLLAQGLTNRQIAAALSISEHTVKFHVSAIYAKMRVSNRAEAVRTGARRGLVAL